MRKITLVVEYKGRCVRKLNAQIRRNKIFDWGHGSGENGRIIGDIEKCDRTENVGENGELSERKENFWSPM